MPSKVYSAAIVGLEAQIIEVEVLEIKTAQ